MRMHMRLKLATTCVPDICTTLFCWVTEHVDMSCSDACSEAHLARSGHSKQAAEQAKSVGLPLYITQYQARIIH